MKITLTKTGLASRIIRRTITDETGVREIKKPSSGLAGFFSDILSGLVAVTKTILNVLGWVGATISAIASWLVAAVKFIWYFDWNITDEAIDQKAEQMKILIAGQLGETVGDLMGRTACGVLPSAAIYIFNAPLGSYLLNSQATEILEELTGNLVELGRITTQSFISYWAYQGYKNIRKFIKEAAKNPDGLISTFGKRIFGEQFQTMVDSWGKAESKPWSFSKAFQTIIDSIEDPILQEYWEEFWDAFFDGCEESFMLLANDIDDWIMKQRLQKESLLGKQDGIEILLDRTHDETEQNPSRIVLPGRQELLKPVILQTLANSQMLNERDIGYYCGEPVRYSTVEKKIQPLQIRIFLSSHQHVYSPSYRRVVVTVPDIDRPKLDWDKIKQAVGGTNGYNWGKFRVRAMLSTGNAIQVYAGSTEEGEDVVKALAELTTGQITSMTTTEELNEGTRKVLNSVKKTTRIYPQWFNVLNQEKLKAEAYKDSKDPSVAKYAQAGVFMRKRATDISLRGATKPSDYDAMLAELFYVPPAPTN